MHLVTPYKGTVLDSGFHAMDFGFQVLDSRFFISGTWIPDSIRWRDSRFLELYSGFQKSRFRIVKAKIYLIPNFTSKNFLVPYLELTKCCDVIPFFKADTCGDSAALGKRTSTTGPCSI